MFVFFLGETGYNLFYVSKYRKAMSKETPSKWSMSPWPNVVLHNIYRDTVHENQLSYLPELSSDVQPSIRFPGAWIEAVSFIYT